MNLQELKQNIRVETDMSTIYSKIKRYAEAGDAYVTFDHRGSEEEDQISDSQVDILIEDGYTVCYNSACLWYEVSGWK